MTKLNESAKSKRHVHRVRRLSKLFEFPEELFGSTPCLTLRGGVLTIWSCGEILCYEDGCVRLAIECGGGRRCTAEINGEGLYMRSFLDGAVTVEGNIGKFMLDI